jgi:hypothetical protein
MNRETFCLPQRPVFCAVRRKIGSSRASGVQDGNPLAQIGAGVRRLTKDYG